MPGQAADARHTANTDQGAAAALHHSVHKRLEGGRHADVIGGKGARHDVDIGADGGVHAHADAGVGNDDVGQALAGNAIMARGHDAFRHRHIGTINFIAISAYCLCANP